MDNIDLTLLARQREAYRRRRDRLELIVATAIWLAGAAALVTFIVLRILWDGPNWVW